MTHITKPRIYEEHWFPATPLHFAAMNGHSAVVEFLLQNTNSKCIQDFFKQIQKTTCLSPLDLAAINGHINVVNMLVKCFTELLNFYEKQYMLSKSILYAMNKNQIKLAFRLKKEYIN